MGSFRLAAPGRLRLSASGKLALAVTSAVEEIPIETEPGALWTGDVIVLGDSLTALNYAAAGYRWGLPLSRISPRMIYNAGVAGDTLAQILGRIDADVLAYSPSVVMMRGGTNSLSMTDAAFKAKYREIIDKVLDNGIKMVLHAIPPKGLGDAPKIIEYNRWLAQQASTDPSRLRYVADGNTIGDANYAYIPEYYLDGVHMSPKGQRAMGVAMAPRLREIFAPIDPRILDASDTYTINPASNQWVKNPHMAGTAGTKTGNSTGTVPDHWKVLTSGTGTAVVTSIIAADAGDPVQVPWMRVAIQSAGGDNQSVTIETRLGHPAIAADNTVKLVDVTAECRFVDFNPAPLSSLQMYADVAGFPVGSSLSMRMDDFGGLLNETIVPRTSMMRGQGGAALAAYAANSMDMTIKLQFQAAHPSPIGYFDIRCASVRGVG